ncbi:hypothetical protein H0H93_003751, partial [Arthromyces matolae]
MSVTDAEALIAKQIARRSTIEAHKEAGPKYLRYNYYSPKRDRHTPSMAEWSETAPPLPYPPVSAINDAATQKTIRDYSHLFRIVTPINVPYLESISTTHPNQPWVRSLKRCLEE